MKLSDPYANYPSQWAEFDKHAHCGNPEVLNLAGSMGDVNRFGARFRMAKAFRGLNLDDYSLSSIQGYSALCRVMFTWSAFEQFMKVIDTKQLNLSQLLAKHNTSTLQQQIRLLDVDDRLYKFIYDRVNPRHKAELDNYFNTDPCNVTYLASAIRHLFAHGTLTPNANQVEPRVVVEVCELLSCELIKIMDIEFSERIVNFLKEAYPYYF